MAEFINSKYGNRKLSYQGHLYNLHAIDDDGKRRYRCFNYKKFKCKGWAHYFDGNVNVTQEHSFPCIPAPAVVNAHRVDANIREISQTSRERPRTIATEVLAHVDKETINCLPIFPHLERRIAKQKNRINNVHPVPHNRHDIEIPNELRTTKTQPEEVFLLHDSGRDDPERIIAFGSPSDLQRLGQSETWLAGGTFDVS